MPATTRSVTIIITTMIMVIPGANRHRKRRLSGVPYRPEISLETDRQTDGRSLDAQCSRSDGEAGALKRKAQVGANAIGTAAAECDNNCISSSLEL